MLSNHTFIACKAIERIRMHSFVLGKNLNFGALYFLKILLLTSQHSSVVLWYSVASSFYRPRFDAMKSLFCPLLFHLRKCQMLVRRAMFFDFTIFEFFLSGAIHYEADYAVFMYNLNKLKCSFL